MNPVTARGVTIGEGIPKICVPALGATTEEIIHEANAAKESPADLIEWRADWFDLVFDLETVKETLAKLRAEVKELPVLFTFRTANEGGEKSITAEAYHNLLQAVIQTGDADLIDVELFSGDDIVKSIVDAAHSHGVKVLASNHDFKKTPERDEIVQRLCKMQELGADLLKIAVMPQSTADVLTLLAATEEMNRKYANRPVITMSMSGMGAVSRLCGEVFGSALTFGAAKKTSAPGQIDAEELSCALSLLHNCLRL